MRRALGVCVLGLLLFSASPAPASAHAEVLRSSPRNGSTVAHAPQVITVTFGEVVNLDASGVRVTGPDGSTVPADAAARGAVLSVRPVGRLPIGPVALSFHVVSEDGHPISGAIAFVIGSAGPRGAPATIATTPSVRTDVSGRRPGPLTVVLDRLVSGGSVQWTSAEQPEPITWRVRSDGPRAVASGVLPRAGTWQLRATLEGAHFTVLVVTGTLDVVPRPSRKVGR